MHHILKHEIYKCWPLIFSFWTVCSQSIKWVNLDQKAPLKYIKVLAYHIKGVLICASDQFTMELVFDENKINKMHQHATEPICSAIVKI